MKDHTLKAGLIPLFMLLVTACTAPVTAPAQSTTPNAIPQPSSTPIPSSTPQPSSTLVISTPTSVAATSTPILSTSTETLVPAPTFPLELTQTPGIIATATAFAAASTAEYLKYSALFGSTADMLGIMQYYNPVGTPLKSWHAIPIMTQATQGQEFKADIYSYKATTTLQVAAQFYDEQAVTLNWTCNPATTGTAGTGITAEHLVTLTCRGFIISLTSFDQDTSHVIAVLNKAP